MEEFCGEVWKAREGGRSGKVEVLGCWGLAVLINYVLCSGLLLIGKKGLQVILLYIMQQDTHPTAIQSKPDSMQSAPPCNLSICLIRREIPAYY